MKVLSILLASVMLLTSCNKSSIRGSGNTITESRTVAAFTGVKAQGSITVEIKKGTAQKVTVEGYANLVPIFETFISNGTLVLKFRDDYYNIRNNNIKVYVELTDLKNAIADGSGNISISNFNGSDLALSINGSGDITTQNCVYNNAVYKVNGSGNIDAAQVSATNCDVDMNGSGNINLYCTQQLKATIHGSGDINYWGNPAIVNTEVSGSGRIRKK